MKGFILGIIVTLVGLALGAYIYFSTGMVPVATHAQAMPFEKKLAAMGLNAHVAKEAPKTPPQGIESGEPTFIAGANIYKNECAFCHGLPGQAQQPDAAKGMFPKPPQLFQGHGVTDDPPGETYWKVKNGIRLTGMPAFQKSLSEKQLWQVSLLLANADKIPASVQQVLGGAMNPAGEGGHEDHEHPGADHKD
ncbi:MAG: c-type cytochrome [Terriglobales bacterium]